MKNHAGKLRRLESFLKNTGKHGDCRSKEHIQTNDKKERAGYQRDKGHHLQPFY